MTSDNLFDEARKIEDARYRDFANDPSLVGKAELREQLLLILSGCGDSDYPKADQLVCPNCRKEFIGQAIAIQALCSKEADKKVVKIRENIVQADTKEVEAKTKDWREGYRRAVSIAVNEIDATLKEGEA
jgi:hypothetical protein